MPRWNVREGVMKSIRRELKYLVLSLIIGALCLPIVYGWVTHLGFTILPGTDQTAPLLRHLHVFRHLQEPLPLVILLFPYLMFLGARALRERPAAEQPATGLTDTGDGESQPVQRVAFLGRKHVPAAAHDPSTRLQHAALHGDIGLLAQLLEDGADFNARDQVSGLNPLHVAAQQGHAAVSDLLIRYGADVDAVTDRQETALHLAAQRGHAGVVATLLKYRAGTRIMDTAGLTAQQLALRDGHTEVVRMLEQHVREEWPYLRLAGG